MPKISSKTVASAIPALDPEQERKMYKENYEFNKPAPDRSPVEPYLHDRIVNNDMYFVSKKEANMAKGNPHRFKNVRTGSVYSNRRAMVRTRTK